MSQVQAAVFPCIDPWYAPHVGRLVGQTGIPPELVAQVPTAGNVMGQPEEAVELVRDRYGEVAIVLKPHEDCHKHGKDNERTKANALHYAEAFARVGFPTGCFFINEHGQADKLFRFGDDPILDSFERVAEWSKKQRYPLCSPELHTVMWGKHFHRSPARGYLHVSADFVEQNAPVVAMLAEKVAFGGKLNVRFHYNVPNDEREQLLEHLRHNAALIL